MNRTSLELARTAAGLVNVFQPEHQRVSRGIARVAGARHILQAAVTLAVPELRVLGVVTDGLHALSMLGLGAFSARTRRTALSQALVAGAFAAAEYWALQDQPARRGGRLSGRRS